MYCFISISHGTTIEYNIQVTWKWDLHHRNHHGRLELKHCKKFETKWDSLHLNYPDKNAAYWIAHKYTSMSGLLLKTYKKKKKA